MSDGKPALIQVVSVQEDAQRARETHSRIYRGEVHRLPQGLALRYTETDEEGAATHVALERTLEGVLLRRKGMCSAQMLLIPGREGASVYETPFGAMDLTVRTQEASWTEQGVSSRIALRYDVYVQGELLSRNTVTLTYREKP